MLNLLSNYLIIFQGRILFHVSAAVVQCVAGTGFSSCLPTLLLAVLSDYNHSTAGCEVVSCGFNFHFRYSVTISCACWPFFCLSENVYLDYLPMFVCVVFLFLFQAGKGKERVLLWWPQIPGPKRASCFSVLSS